MPVIEDSKEKITAALNDAFEDLEKEAQQKDDRIDTLELRAKELEKDLEDTRKELETEEDTEAALELLFRTCAGRALIERAFRADPRKSGSDLSYLGGDAIRGELEIKIGLEQRAAAPPPPPSAPPAPPAPPVPPKYPALIRITPRS